MLLAEVNRNEEGDHQIKVLEFFLINKRKIKSGLCQKKSTRRCHVINCVERLSQRQIRLKKRILK